MRTKINIGNITNELCQKLNPKNGKILPVDCPESSYWHIVYNVVWKRGIHFIAAVSSFGGQYYVMRDNCMISRLYHFSRTDDELYRKMQKLINEIDSGKYLNKKTIKEQVSEIVEQRGLTSFMNNTKWRELLNALNENIDDIEIQYKTLFEIEPPDQYWELNGDEYIKYMNYAVIEWLKIKTTLTKVKSIGVLLPLQVDTSDKTEDILHIFKIYNITYEYDDSEQAFVVYGYR